MTLTEIRNQLIGHLIKKDQFSLKDDCSSIKVSKDQIAIKNDLIKLTFKDLEKGGMVMKTNLDGEDLWILEFPLGQQGQQVRLSFEAANAVADLLNQFKEVLGNGKNTQPTEVLNITEQDIIQMVMMCRQLLEKEDKD